MDKMDDLLTKFCRPVSGGAWDVKLSNGFGPLTPCFLDTVVVNVSSLVLLAMTAKRIRHLRSNALRRFSVRSKFLHYFAILLGLVCTAAPLVQIFLKYSTANTNGEDSLPPHEITSLVIKAVVWALITWMLCIESAVYVKEHIWYVRFGILYVLVANLAKFRDVFELRQYFPKMSFEYYAGAGVCEVF